VAPQNGVWTATAVQRALFTRRRKEAYEALHPETRNEAFHGNQHKSGVRQLGEEQSARFTADTATKTGQSERVVQRDAARGKNIAPEVLTQIVGTKMDTGRTLDELASVLPSGILVDLNPRPILIQIDPTVRSRLCLGASLIPNAGANGPVIVRGLNHPAKFAIQISGHYLKNCHTLVYGRVI
jgi:hypothetical protein